MEILINLTKTLIGFESDLNHPEETKKAYEHLASIISDEVFDIEYIEHQGVLSQVIFFKGTNWREAKLLLNGHMDVIPAEAEQFHPRVEDGKLFGRGSADMKGGIAAMLLAMKDVAASGARPSVALLLTGDEEVGGDNGAGHICKTEAFTPDFVLVADGPSVTDMHITNREKGFLWLKLTASGKAGHASRPWLSINALDLIHESVGLLRSQLHLGKEEGWKSTLSVTNISTPNTTTNKIPDEASAVFDIRFTEELGVHQDIALEKISALLPEGVSAEVLCAGAPVYTPEENEHIAALKDIAKDVSGAAMPVVYSDAAHDAGYFAEKGLKTALVGPVGANWHGKNEWVDLETLGYTYEILRKFIQRF